MLGKQSAFIFCSCFLRWELKRLLEWNPPKKGLKILFREVESAIFLAWNSHRHLAPPNTVRNFWSAKRGIEGDDPRSLCAYLPSASCWPSWPFAVRPRFIAGRDLGSRPLVPNVGLVGFLLLLGRLHCYGLLGHSYCSTAVFSAWLLLGWEESTWWKMSCWRQRIFSLLSLSLRCLGCWSEEGKPPYRL